MRPWAFQSTLPRGERLSVVGDVVAEYLFQSTLPRGERQDVLELYTCIKRFQSTLPRGERLVNYDHDVEKRMFQIGRAHV